MYGTILQGITCYILLLPFLIKLGLLLGQILNFIAQDAVEENNIKIWPSKSPSFIKKGNKKLKQIIPRNMVLYIVLSPKNYT